MIRAGRRKKRFVRKWTHRPFTLNRNGYLPIRPAKLGDLGVQQELKDALCSEDQNLDEHQSAVLTLTETSGPDSLADSPFRNDQTLDDVADFSFTSQNSAIFDDVLCLETVKNSLNLIVDESLYTRDRITDVRLNADNKEYHLAEAHPELNELNQESFPLNEDCDALMAVDNLLANDFPEAIPIDKYHDELFLEDMDCNAENAPMSKDHPGYSLLRQNCQFPNSIRMSFRADLENLEVPNLFPQRIRQQYKRHVSYMSSLVMNPTLEGNRIGYDDDGHMRAMNANEELDYNLDDVSPLDFVYDELEELILHFFVWTCVRSPSPSEYKRSGDVTNDYWDTKILHRHHSVRKAFSSNEPLRDFPLELRLIHCHISYPPESYTYALPEYVPENGGVRPFETVDILENPLSSYILPYEEVKESEIRPRKIKRRPRCHAPLPVFCWPGQLPPKYEDRLLGEHSDPLNFANIPMDEVVMKPYVYPYSVAEYMNHVTLIIALDRIRMNEDDHFGNTILKDILDALPRRMIATEVRRIFTCPDRALNHDDVTCFVDEVRKRDGFINQMHMLLAIDYLRSFDFQNMEREVFRFCYGHRYRRCEFDFQPFLQNGFFDTAITHRHSIFERSAKALLITSYFNIIGGNFARANHFVEDLFQLDFNQMPHNERLLHWTVLVRTQVQVSECDIYAHNPAFFFTKLAYFPKIGFVETLGALSKIVDQLKGRIALRIKGHIDCKSEPVRDAYYRLMVLSFIVQTGRTMCRAKLNKEMAIDGQIFKYAYIHERCRMVNKMFQTIMRSFIISGLQIIYPSSLKYPCLQIVPCLNSAGHPTESMIIENVLDAYEDAYNGDFGKAVTIAERVATHAEYSVVGRRHADIGAALIKYDELFFSGKYGYSELSKLLKSVYDLCPAEAVLRDVVLQLNEGHLNSESYMKLQWICNQCTAMGLWPNYRVRCHVVLSQIYLFKGMYEAALDELSLAEKHSGDSPGFLMMIERRRVQVYYLSKKFNKCIVSLSTLTSELPSCKLPLLESAMINLIQFTMRFRLIDLLPASETDVVTLFGFLEKATDELVKFPICRRNLLGVRLGFLRYLKANDLCSFEGYDVFYDNVIRDLKYFYHDSVGIKEALSIRFLTSFTKEYGIPMYVL